VEKRIRAAVVTVSTRSSTGEREDTSGPAIRDLINDRIGETVFYTVVTDDLNIIKEELIRICDELKPDVLFTLGGTGLAPSDVTPEATESIIERRVPGISEALRMQSLQKTNRAMLSRGISGVRKNTLIINMPGSERAARESFDIVQPVLQHAVDLIHNTVEDCGRPIEKG
jgi:molybdenum cofactor synthesis domain-containing protein